jgi:hypothetical protein
LDEFLSSRPTPDLIRGEPGPIIPSVAMGSRIAPLRGLPGTTTERLKER